MRRAAACATAAVAAALPAAHARVVGLRHAGGSSFALVEYNVADGSEVSTLLNGSVPCPPPPPSGGLKMCQPGGGSDGAAATVVAAAESPTGRAVVYAAIPCTCAKQLSAKNQLLISTNPTIVEIDPAAHTLRKVAFTPNDIYNLQVSAQWPSVNWDSASGRIIVGGQHCHNSTSMPGNPDLPGCAASCYAYVAVDPTTGATSPLAEGLCSRPFDGDGWAHLSGLEVLNGSLAVSQYLHNVDHHIVEDSVLIGVNPGTGEVALNLSLGVGLYSLNRQPGGSDFVGFGVCCDPSRIPGCPAVCTAGAVGQGVLVRWTPGSEPSISVLNGTFTDLGMEGVFGIGSALSGGRLSAMVILGGGAFDAAPAAPPTCGDVAKDNRTTCGGGRSGGPGNVTACAAAACCWDEYNNWCWEEGHPRPPGPTIKGFGLLSIDVASGHIIGGKPVRIQGKATDRVLMGLP